MKIQNKYNLILIFILFSIKALSQVNLDRPYLGKTGNTLFFDTSESQLVWVIPKYLVATSVDDKVRVGDEYRVRFNVSLPDFAKMDLIPEAGNPTTFRAFRATQVYLEDFTDVDPKLNPKLTALGDSAMFGETIPYSLSLQANKYPRTARHTIRHLFDGKNLRVLGRVKYFFSALRGGQPFEAQSVVSIIVPRKSMKEKVKSNLGLSNSLNLLNQISVFKDSTRELQFEEDSLYNPKILLHSQTGCWDQDNENTICLRN